MPIQNDNQIHCLNATVVAAATAVVATAVKANETF